jgi:hypothetical protein
MGKTKENTAPAAVILNSFSRPLKKAVARRAAATTLPPYIAELERRADLIATELDREKIRGQS